MPMINTKYMVTQCNNHKPMPAMVMPSTPPVTIRAEDLLINRPVLLHNLLQNSSVHLQYLLKNNTSASACQTPVWRIC